MQSLESLGDFVRNRRRERCLSQKQLATAAGVSRRHLALLESGGNVSVVYLLKVLEVLRIDLLVRKQRDERCSCSPSDELLVTFTIKAS